MKIISHRANLSGPDTELENLPESIDKTIFHGFDVEIDLWVIEKMGRIELYLGHDEPVYEIDNKFLEERKEYLWIHAKNREALEFLSKTNLHYFFHNIDKYTITSKGYIWTYKGEILVKNKEKSICVLPEVEGKENMNENEIYGICTDYPLRYL